MNQLEDEVDGHVQARRTLGPDISGAGSVAKPDTYSCSSVPSPQLAVRSGL